MEHKSNERRVQINEWRRGVIQFSFEGKGGVRGVIQKNFGGPFGPAGVRWGGVTKRRGHGTGQKANLPIFSGDLNKVVLLLLQCYSNAALTGNYLN